MTIRKLKITFAKNSTLIQKGLEVEEYIAFKKDKVMYEYSNNAPTIIHPYVSMTYLPSNSTKDEQKNYKADFEKMCQLSEQLVPCEDNYLCDALPGSVEIYYDDNTRRKIKNLAVKPGIDPIWDEISSLAEKYIPLDAKNISRWENKDE